MKSLLFYTSSSRSISIIRLMVGTVFLSEGIQKFLFPAIRGAGRFAKIGLPNPDLLGNFVGTCEIIFGLMILIGLLTRLSSLVTFTIMCVAIITTKIPMLASHDIWYMLHQARTDWAMLLGSLFLIINGGGSISLDRLIQQNIAK
ncbi:DoxX family protein [Halosquirtibacter xylanolyticus]|nr:DoxX family protein [Prolixibacteraceae bacterium]